MIAFTNLREEDFKVYVDKGTFAFEIQSRLDAINKCLGTIIDIGLPFNTVYAKETFQKGLENAKIGQIMVF
jgi:hypothetical protein